MSPAALVRRIAWSAASAVQGEARLTREWLVTNGLGGYASGTVAGVTTRRYHGLLVAALPAPLGRVVMLNHLTERYRDAHGHRLRARRRGARRGRPRLARRASHRVPPGGRPPHLALRVRGRRGRASPAAASSAEHDVRDLAPDPGRTAASHAGPGAELPAPRSSGVDQPGQWLQPHRHRRPLRDSRPLPGTTAALAAAREPARVHDRAPPGGAGALPRRTQPRLRRHRGAVESRLVPHHAAPGRRSHPGRVHRGLGSSNRALAGGGSRRGARATAAPDRGGAARRPDRGGRRARAGRRPVRDHTVGTGGGLGPGAGGRRRGPDRDRRLSLVHRLGPRHDDLARGAHAGDRPVPGGGLHPPDLRPLRARRIDPQPLPGGREPRRVPHRRRDAVVLPRAAPLREDDGGSRDADAAAAHAARRRRPARAGARGSGSPSIPPTDCSGRALPSTP